MLRPPNPTLDALFIQKAIDSIESVKMTSAERQALLLTGQVVFGRDLHALRSASVVFLFNLPTVQSQAEMVQEGPSVFVDHGMTSLVNRVRLLMWLAAEACMHGRLGHGIYIHMPVL